MLNIKIEYNRAKRENNVFDYTENTGDVYETLHDSRFYSEMTFEWNIGWDVDFFRNCRIAKGNGSEGLIIEYSSLHGCVYETIEEIVKWDFFLCENRSNIENIKASVINGNGGWIIVSWNDYDSDEIIDILDFFREFNIKAKYKFSY